MRRTLRVLLTALVGSLLPGCALAMLPEAAKSASIWAIVVLGIPLGVLAASLAGSAARYLREASAPDKKIPAMAMDTVIDGFIGGWIAMFLLGLPYTSKHLGPVVRPEIVGALCALLVQFVRTHGKVYFDRLFDTVLGWFTRKRAAAEVTRDP